MRSELEAIKYIEDYLTGKLTPEEEVLFEVRLSEDLRFKDEYEAQKLLMERVRAITLKKTIQNAHHKFYGPSRFSFSNKWLLPVFTGVFITVVILVITKTTQKDSQADLPFVNPPVGGADVPCSEYLINAGDGGVITYSSGSLIFIPPDAFVDAGGKIIKGDVKLEYREFSDPVDFYLAGIPMDVNSNGRVLTMESAAMCEIKATYGGINVRLNPVKKISVFQTSYTTSDAFSLFYLDPVKKQWVIKGKDTPICVQEINDKFSAKDELSYDIQSDEDISAPVKPKKADEGRYSFFISFDEKEFPELAGYKNVVFEIDETETKFNPKDGKTDWNNVEIKKAVKNGRYQITFISISAKRTVEYIAFPVFKGEYYEGAIKVYEKKFAEYNLLRVKRIKREIVEKEAVINYRRKIDSINKAVELRNVVVAKQNRITDSINMGGIISVLDYMRSVLLETNVLAVKQSKQLMGFDYIQLFENKKLIEDLYQKNLKRMQNLYNRASDARENVVRGYQIDGFGIWNCDILTLPMQGERQMHVRFKDGYSGLMLTKAVLVDKTRRSLTRYDINNAYDFKFNPGNKIIIWEITKDRRLVYFNDFKNIPETEEYTFNLKTFEKFKEDGFDYPTVRKTIEELMEY